MTPELSRRIWFTLGALLVYRFGSYIPLPGIAPATWDQIFRSQAGGILGMFNLFSGGGIQRMAIFALGLLPYLSAAILLQLLSILWGRLRALRNQGERGRWTVDAYTWYLTALLSIFQSYGIAIGLEGVPNLVAEPGWLFRMSTVLTLTGGVMLLVWLTGRITARGIGNGVTLILFGGIVAELPAAIVGILELGRQGALSNGMILTLFGSTVALIALVVVVERARRRLPVIKSQGAEAAPHWHLPLKLNSAGVMPTVLASLVLFLPMAIAHGLAPGWPSARLGGALFMVVHAILIVGCTFFYTAFLVDPDEAAETLRRYGGVIPGIRPGEHTAEYIDYVVTRITTIGAVYLAFVYLTPAVLVASMSAPFYVSGASLLIVVCAILDLEEHVRAYASVTPGARQQ